MAIKRRTKEKGAVWHIDFILPNGERFRRSSKTSNKIKAQQLHDKLKAEAWDQIYFDKQPEYLWDEVVEIYLDEKRNISSYGDILNHIKFLNKYLKGVPLNKISDNLVKHITKERSLSKYKYKDNGKEHIVKTRTVNATLSVMRAILNWAKKELKWIDNLPTIKKVKPAKNEKKRTNWLTKEEAERLINELPSHLKSLVKFSLATGLRHFNVTHLEWSQINLDNKTAWFYADEVKNDIDLSIPLNDDAMAVLLEEKGKHPTRVFTYDGKIVNSANTKAWRKALDRAGIAPYQPEDSNPDSNKYPSKPLDQYKYSQFRYHDLRHTWASWHVQSGTPLIILQELGGWKTFEMVLRYAHLGEKHTQAYANNSGRMYP